MTRTVITAVPSMRLEYTAYLRRLLPHAEWVFDQKQDSFDTFLRAMALPGDAPCVHLEDDVILTTGFIGLVEAAIAARPGEVQQFFSMRGDDKTIGSRWDNNFIATLAWYVPAGWAPRLIAYYPEWLADWKLRDAAKPQNPPTWLVGYDIFVRDFLKWQKQRYWIVCPNLVNHRIGKSAIDPRRSSTTRVSKTFRNPEL
jgi:hypothetical protein